MTELHQKLETRLAKQGKPASGADSLAALVERMRGEIAKALPRHIQENGPRYARTAVTLIRSNPKLAACSPVSFLSSLMTASSLGLDLNPALGQCYLVPRQRRIKTIDQPRPFCNPSLMTSPGQKEGPAGCGALGFAWWLC